MAVQTGPEPCGRKEGGLREDFTSYLHPVCALIAPCLHRVQAYGSEIREAVEKPL